MFDSPPPKIVPFPALFAGYLRSQTHSEYLIVLLFSCNYGCTYQRASSLHCLSWLLMALVNYLIYRLRPTEQEYCLFFVYTTARFGRSLWPSWDTCTFYRKKKVCQVDDFIISALLWGNSLKVAIVFAWIRRLIQRRQTPSSYTRGAQIPGARSSWRLNFFYGGA
jgi:hypothetical protein